MKKYIFCFLLFIVTSAVCFGIGFLIMNYTSNNEESTPQATIEIETTTEEYIAENQDEVEMVHAKNIAQYYLVAEDGYLLVTHQDKVTICLYTHMPITDFPEEERAKLMEGIWFSTMIEVFNYLESHTS